MTKLDDILHYIGMSGPATEDDKQAIKGLILETYKEAQDMRNHTGISFESAFKQLVEEL